LSIHRGHTWKRAATAGFLSVLISCAMAAMALSALPADAATRTFTGIGVTADGSGYGLAASSGEVYAYGSVAYHGNPAGFSGSIVGISVTANGQGYVAESSIGQVYAYGTVKYWGNGDPGSNSISNLRIRIAGIANSEYQNPAHRSENPADSNCNYYTTALNAGSTGCANGWRSEEWCADFARWVWGQAGAVTDKLSPGAISFETYGSAHGTWHAGASLSGIQVGDVIGWNFGGSTSDDHVSVVVAVNSSGIVNTLDGNWSNAISSRTISPNTSGISGYTSPTT
jgi:CHAP domain